MCESLRRSCAIARVCHRDGSDFKSLCASAINVNLQCGFVYLLFIIASDWDRRVSRELVSNGPRIVPVVEKAEAGGSVNLSWRQR
jgi:hypothetical protein